MNVGTYNIKMWIDENSKNKAKKNLKELETSVLLKSLFHKDSQ